MEHATRISCDVYIRGAKEIDCRCAAEEMLVGLLVAIAELVLA